MPLQLLAARVARDLPQGAALWLAPELRSAFPRLPDDAMLVEVPTAADTAVLWATELGPNGSVLGDGPAIDGPRVIAIMQLGEGGRIVAREAPARAHASRVYTDLGVLDVIGPELVIVELAAGVSAVDMQRHAEPTLEISVAVRQMIVSAPSGTDS